MCVYSYGVCVYPYLSINKQRSESLQRSENQSEYRIPIQLPLVNSLTYSFNYAPTEAVLVAALAAG